MKLNLNLIIDLRNEMNFDYFLTLLYWTSSAQKIIIICFETIKLIKSFKPFN